jgi:hypothetical protein
VDHIRWNNKWRCNWGITVRETNGCASVQGGVRRRRRKDGNASVQGGPRWQKKPIYLSNVSESYRLAIAFCSDCFQIRKTTTGMLLLLILRLRCVSGWVDHTYRHAHAVVQDVRTLSQWSSPRYDVAIATSQTWCQLSNQLTSQHTNHINSPQQCSSVRHKCWNKWQGQTNRDVWPSTNEGFFTLTLTTRFELTSKR